MLVSELALDQRAQAIFAEEVAIRTRDAFLLTVSSSRRVEAHRSLLVKAATAFDCVAASNRSLLGSFLPLLLFLVRLLLSDLLELFLGGQTWKSVELRPDVTHALALGDSYSPG